MVKKYFNLIILFITLIGLIIVYQVMFTKPLYVLKISLQKNNANIYENFPFYNSLNEPDESKFRTMNLILDEQKKSFEGIIYYENNSNAILKEIYDICKEFEISYVDFKYHSIKCLTEQPKLALKIIEKNINLIWENINTDKFQPFTIKTKEKFQYVKLLNESILKSNNQLKNIFAFSGILILLFLGLALKKKLIKF